MSLFKSEKTFELSVISKYRLQIMGFAAVWIVFHHMYELKLSAIPGVSGSMNIFFTVISVIKQLGPAGLEMFLICSGIGLYYSFSKNSNILSFYKKRAVRLLPAVFTVSFIYYAFSDVGIREYFSSALLIDFYTKGNSNFWYFAFIIVMYLLYPVIHRFVEKSSDITVIGVSVLLIVIISVLAFGFRLDLGTRYYAICRVPAFVLSVLIGKKSYNKTEISVKWIPVLALITVVFALIISCLHFDIIKLNILNSAHVYHFLNIPFAFSFTVLLSLILSCFRLRCIKSLLAVFGTVSMEIYLLFEKVVKALISVFSIRDATNISFYVTAFLLTVVLSFLLNIICKNVVSVFTKEYKSIN